LQCEGKAKQEGRDHHHDADMPGHEAVGIVFRKGEVGFHLADFRKLRLTYQPFSMRRRLV
jgi:hypothetical protein